MSEILITYDVDANNTQIRNELIENGFRKTITGNNGDCKLPNTTLYHPNTTSDVAYTTLARIVHSNKSKLLRAIVVEMAGTWHGIIGDSF